MPVPMFTEEVPPLLRTSLSIKYTHASAILKNYSWPGNIRELRILCERLSILLAGKVIEVEHLPSQFFSVASGTSLEGFVLPHEGLNLEQLEVELIQQALNRTKGNRSKSAKLLGLTRDTLLYRMQKYGFRDSGK